MAMDSIFNNASSVMTVVSLITFLGVLWWTFVLKRSADFDAAAHVPFADDSNAADDHPQAGSVWPSETHHV